MILLEVGNLDGLVILLYAIMLGPPILFTILGFRFRKNHPTASKVLFIMGGLYLLIGFGVCGSILTS